MTLCACASTQAPTPKPAPPPPAPEQVFLEGEDAPLFAELDDHDAFAPLAETFEAKVSLLVVPELQRYVAGVGARVAAQALPKDSSHRFSFRIIDDPDTVNAVTLPGGYIYVYSGLLLALRDEAELAGVLSHEIAHTTRRHVRAARLVEDSLDAGEALSGPLLGRMLPELQKVWREGVLATFSREQELEADRLAMVYVLRAGYSPFAIPDFLRRLGRKTRSSRPPSTPLGMMARAALNPKGIDALTRDLLNPDFQSSALMASHPHPSERERTLRLLLDRVMFTPSDEPPTRQTDSFLAFHKRLLAAHAPKPQDAP